MVCRLKWTDEQKVSSDQDVVMLARQCMSVRQGSAVVDIRSPRLKWRSSVEELIVQLLSTIFNLWYSQSDIACTLDICKLAHDNIYWDPITKKPLLWTKHAIVSATPRKRIRIAANLAILELSDVVGGLLSPLLCQGQSFVFYCYFAQSISNHPEDCSWQLKSLFLHSITSPTL